MTEDKEDFLSLWKRTLAAQDQQWSVLFDRALSSEAVAAQFGKVLEGYLQMTRVSRENVEKCLQAANLPTRGDVALLAKRIDDLSNRIEELARTLHTAAPAHNGNGVQQPAATKQPAAAPPSRRRPLRKRS